MARRFCNHRRPISRGNSTPRVIFSGPRVRRRARAAGNRPPLTRCGPDAQELPRLAGLDQASQDPVRHPILFRHYTRANPPEVRHIELQQREQAQQQVRAALWYGIREYLHRLPPDRTIVNNLRKGVIENAAWVQIPVLTLTTSTVIRFWNATDTAATLATPTAPNA